jgi:hypothetical protein
MGSVVGNTYLTTMTPEMASKWLSDFEYEHQRNVAQNTVDFYAGMMESGEWVPGTNIKLATVNGSGRKVLVDGRHRLCATVVSGTPQVYSVTEIKCDTDADVARVYYTTDRGRNRTYGDAWRTTLIADELGLTNSQVNTAGAGVRFIMADFKRQSANMISMDSMLEQVRFYADGIGRYFECIAGTSQHMEPAMRRAAVVSVGIATLQYAINIYGFGKVEDFWIGLVRDDGLRAGDPRKVANIHLLSTGIMASSGRTQEQVSANYQARYIANCFNAWVEDREFKVARTKGYSKVHDSNAPIKINGTPWKG